MQGKKLGEGDYIVIRHGERHGFPQVCLAGVHVAGGAEGGAAYETEIKMNQAEAAFHGQKAQRGFSCGLCLRFTLRGEKIFAACVYRKGDKLSRQPGELPVPDPLRYKVRHV